MGRAHARVPAAVESDDYLIDHRMKAAEQKKRELGALRFGHDGDPNQFLRYGQPG